MPMNLKEMDKPNFGKIQLDNLEDYYDSTIKYGQRKINIDINFEVKSSSQTELNRVLNFIGKIPELDRINENYINLDLKKSPSMSHDYLRFYIEELEDELNNIIDVSGELQIDIIKLKEKLNLVRVGIYPQADYYGTFDYSIDLDGEPCNQLLVINLNEDGSLNYITWES